MDPWAELRQILEHPLPDKSILMRTLSWTQIRPPLPISPSFDMFGEIQFKEKPPPLASSAPSETAMSWMEEDEGGRQGNDGDLQDGNADCAKGIGSGILQDVEDDDKCCNSQRRKKNKAMGAEHSSLQSDPWTYLRLRSNSDVGSTSIEAFPPPISTIGKGVKPWVYLKSFKKDGRFVLKKIKVPTQQCLQATRENGRLMLHLAHEVVVAKIEEIGNVVEDAEENREEVDSCKRIRDQ